MNNLKTKLAEDLRKWVKEKWVDIGAPKKGGGYKPCGRSEGEKRKGYPKCVPAAKASRMSKKQKKSAVRRKRAAGNPGGKPTMVSTFKSKKESVELFGQIISEKLCAKGKAAAKRKYDVYPSAYANMYASAVCSGKVKSGGKKKKKQNSSTQIYGNAILEAYRKFIGESDNKPPTNKEPGTKTVGGNTTRPMSPEEFKKAISYTPKQIKANDAYNAKTRKLRGRQRSDI